MTTERARRTWGQRLVLLTCVTLVLGLVATAGGLTYAYSKYSRLGRVRLGTVLTERADPGEPRNILLVGVDSAATLDPDDPARAGREDVGGLRSDTMMILRADPATGDARLLSLPRDLWVPLASGGRQRINAAIQIGGPTELIDTIESYLGIPIHHYVQVDFAGFRGLVDVIGGVDVWFEHPARDPRSGLDVPDTGCVTLDPDQALAYVRARHFQQLRDGRWRTDPTGDLGRMSRQQDFIVRALRRAVEKGVRNPVTLDGLIDAALATVTVDDQLRADDIVDLATSFRSFRPDALELHSLPVVSGNAGGASILRIVEDDADAVLDLFRDAVPDGPVVAADVRLAVLNGTGITGQAGEASAALEALGFVSTGTGEAESFDIERTEVRYAPGELEAADLVARHLVAGAVLVEVPAGLDAPVVIVTGSDFAGIRTTPAPATSTTTPPPSMTTTAAAPTTSSSTTSTSVVGQVPAPPAGSGC